MKLQAILDQFRFGELAQLSIGGQDVGVFNDKNYGNIVPHVNMGLTALFTRFPIRERNLIIEIQPNKSEYLLDKAFAESNTKSREPVRYIQDTSDDPFENDVIKVEEVYTDTGVAYRINDGSRHAITTPSTNILKLPKNVPVELKTDTLDVIYRANHPEIVVGLGYFDPERVNVYLPATYLEALVYFVASRMHNPVGMVNDFNAGNNYYMKYENACREIESKGLYIEQTHENDRFCRGGWV